MDNIFDKSYALIDDFISKDENSRLKFGTGRYSALFRGSLFGLTETQSVVRELNNRNNEIKVLWLGSNPNVPSSLEAIKNNYENHYDEFLAQKKCGHFSEVFLDTKSDNFKPEWDPINYPDNRWSFYTEIFASMYGQDHILMANFVPWGSSDFKKLLNEIKKIDEELLNRILDFARELNNLLIKSLKPEILVVPKSIGQFLGQKPQETIPYRIDAKVPFIFNVSKIFVHEYNMTVLTCPHPSYTPRVGKEHRKIIQDKIKEALICAK